MTRKEVVDYIKEWLKDEYALDDQDRIVLTMVIQYINNASTDTVSRQDAILAITGEPPEAHYPSWYAERIKALPSAEVEDRLYIKIYADDEPSVKAEKLYQICGETQNREVAEWLKEYFPSAPDSRQRGEWVRKEKDNADGCHWWYECSECGTKPLFDRRSYSEDLSDFCPNCGADMREPKLQYGDTDTLQGGLMSAT